MVKEGKGVTRRRLMKEAGKGAILTFAGLGALANASEEMKPREAQRSRSVTGAGQAAQMKLGLVTYNMAKDWDLDTIIERCEETGFQGVELRTTHAHKVESNLAAEERKAVREKFKGSRVELVSLGTAFEYHSSDAAVVQKNIAGTKEYLELAKDVGCRGIKVRPNGLPPEVPVEKTLQQIGEALRECGVVGEKLGVEIWLEVHGQGTSHVPHIRTIMDVANHPFVKVCWNSNPTDVADGSILSNLDLVKNKIGSVHMRDLDDENYPYLELFAVLKKVGFSGYCFAEIPGSEDPVRVMRYYRALWQQMVGAA